MNHRHHIALVAGAATLLASLPLSTIFASWSWLFYSGAAIAVVVGVGILTRSLRAPTWVQALAMPGALILFLTWVFSSGEEFLGFLPSLGTLEHFGGLLAEAGAQMREESIPVGDFDGLLLLTTMGVGTVAFLVDIFAVGLRKPALAGLPMLAIYSVPVAVIPDSISFIPFVLGAAGYLWLLVTDSVDRVRRFGRRFTGEGRDVDLWEPSPLAAAGRRLGLAGLVLALFLPLAVPGMSSGLFRPGVNGPLSDDGSGGSGAGAATVDLFGQLTGGLNSERPVPMIEVTTDDPDPYYLRFAVSDVIRPVGFDHKKPGGRPMAAGLADQAVPSGQGIRKAEYTATVTVLPTLDIPYLPVYLQPTSVRDLQGNQWLYDTATAQIHSRVTTSREKKYQFDYVKYSYTPEALRNAPAVTNPQVAGLDEVPAVPQVQELVNNLTAGKETQYDKVRAIYDHFSVRNGFVYDLTAPAGRSGQAIVDFLQAKRGFCVQYAVGMAWLTRQAGFPARIAFGFTRGNGPSGGKYILGPRQLHSWTEVYFEGYGWVPFDATPSSGVPGSVSSLWAPDPIRPGATASPGAVPNEEETAGPEEPTAGPDGAGLDPGATPPAIKGWMVAGGAALVLLLAVLLAPSLRRSALRRQRRARALAGSRPSIDATLGPDPALRAAAPQFEVLADDEGARHDAHAAWEELIDTMVDFEVPVDEAESPRMTGARVGGLLPSGPPREQVGLLARAEERARYARTPIASRELDSAVEGVRRAFAAQASRRQRLSAMLFPKSVLMRWRLAWLRSVGGTIAGFGRWRLRTREVISPRRLLPGRR